MRITFTSIMSPRTCIAGRFRGLLALVCCVCCVTAASAADGTLKWIGSAAGGEWGDPANWQVVPETSTNTVSDLLGKKTIYDIGTLEHDAVLSNNTDVITIAGLTFMPENRGTVWLRGTKNFLLPGVDAQISIGGGNTIEWEMNHPSAWTGDTTNIKLVILGNGTSSGTLHLNPSSAIDTYLLDVQPCGSTTVIIGPRYYSARSYFQLWNTATLRFESDITVGRLICNSGCTVDMNGRTVYVNSGERDTGNGINLGAGKIVGTGSIVWSGAALWQAYCWYESAPLDVTSFKGSWTFYNGRLIFPNTFVFPSSLKFAVNGSAELEVKTDATLNNLTGAGATGGIRMSDGTTLTLSSSEPGRDVYEARVYGTANVVKDGADYELVLTGNNQYTGLTTVAAGTLTLKRPHVRKGLVRRWTFEDSGNVGRDFSPYGADLLNGGEVDAVVTNGGIGGGHALYFPATATKRSYLKTSSTTFDQGFPTGDHPISVSMWLRPEACPTIPTYIYHQGNWGGNGRQFSLWGMNSGTALEVCIDNWSLTDGPSSPIISTPDLMNGQWHHVVFSYETNTLCIWYDGVLKTVKTDTHTLNILNGQEQRLGSYEATKRYVGGMDDVAIWDHALTAEEVAAEYARTNVPADPAAVLPDPVCHWSFNDPDLIGKDEQGHADLIADPATASTPGLVSRKEAIGGFVTSSTTALRLPEANFPENFPTGKSPFTISVRMIAGSLKETTTLLGWGRYSASSNYFRLWNYSCPRLLRITSGNREVPYLRTQCGAGSGINAFTHLVVTGDPKTGLLRLYRDGILETTSTGYTCDFRGGDFILNNGDWKDTGCSNAMFDDVRIYNTALTLPEVQILSRALTGVLGPVLPAESDVTVVSGATLKLDAEQTALRGLAGAGAVTVGPGACLSVTSFSNFTGTVSGPGRLLLRAGQALPLPADRVSVDVGFDDGTIALSSAGDPLVRTTGRIILPETGVFRLDDAVSYRSWMGRAFKIAEASDVVGPPDVSNWTFDPPVPAGEKPVKETLIFSDGVLWLRISGGGTIITVR